MLSISEFESNYFGLNIARCQVHPATLIPEMVAALNQLNIDLLRLKCPSSEVQHIVHSIAPESYFCFYSHSILNFLISYKNTDHEVPKYPELHFKEVTAASKSLFYDTIYKGMYEDPIGYFKTPLVHLKISRDKESACNAAYYAENYTGQYSDKKAWLMYWKEKCVGAFVFELFPDVVHTSLAAVLPEYRSMGLFNEMRVFQKNYCIDHQLATATCGARINNIYTTNHLMGQSWRLVDTASVFHVIKKSSFC